MANLTLKQLRYFDALVQQRHFGRAAEVCAISQPALSMQIKEMEAALGSALFERTPRNLGLTPFGETVVERARDILRSVDELTDLARSQQSKLSGKLRLGVIPTIAPYLLPKVIGALTQSYDGLDIHIRETMTPKLLQELADGKIDAALLALPVGETSFAEVLLFEENFVLVRPAADAQLPPPDAKGLAAMRLLLLEEGHCFRDQALSFCTGPSVRPWEGLDGTSLSTLVQMVGAGIGVTLIPQMAVEVETRSAPVAISALDGAQPSRQIGMIWRKTSPLAELLNDVAHLVQQAASSLAQP